MSSKKIKTGGHTFSEIESQAGSWKSVFTRIERKAEKLKKLYAEAEEIIFTGCGSAFNIPNAVAPVFQKHSGKVCRAVHASELMIHPELFLNKKRKSLVVGYSRSGDTTESANALKQAKNAHAATIAIVCFKDSKMAQLSDTALVLEEAAEKSVTTTRSLTSLTLAGYYADSTLLTNTARLRLESLNGLDLIDAQKEVTSSLVLKVSSLISPTLAAMRVSQSSAHLEVRPFLMRAGISLTVLI
ncbi:hypothetical protein LCGC14_2564260 [marine sediment metagenome]|uniref:SIS domain-containing protein n=1 Tax=marine sediment metagenome TaxID=412755 RepID=A0A0F9B711_9ZZZZ